VHFWEVAVAIVYDDRSGRLFVELGWVRPFGNYCFVIGDGPGMEKGGGSECGFVSQV
jgi:hypothetical protein